MTINWPASQAELDATIERAETQLAEMLAGHRCLVCSGEIAPGDDIPVVARNAETACICGLSPGHPGYAHLTSCPLADRTGDDRGCWESTKYGAATFARHSAGCDIDPRLAEVLGVAL